MRALVRRVRSFDPYVVAIFCVLTATLGLSFKAILIKLAYRIDPSLNPVTLLAARYAFTLPMIAVIAWMMRKQYVGNPINKKDALSIFAMGIVGYYLSSLLDFTGLKYITAGVERLVLFLYPTFVILIVVIYYKEKLSATKLIAIAISYAGIAIVFARQIGGEQINLVLGSSMVLLAAISFAVYTVASSVLVKRIGAIRFTTYTLGTACIFTLLHSALTPGSSLLLLSNQEYEIALTMAVFSTVLPLYLTNIALKQIAASSVSILSTASPSVTLIVAWLVLGETMDATQILGSLLVMVGVYLASRNVTRREKLT